MIFWVFEDDFTVREVRGIDDMVLEEMYILPLQPSPPTDIGGEVDLHLPLQLGLLGHGHCPPGRPRECTLKYTPC